jgi:anaerobic ribonucleoside-triphosphate reductase
MSVTKRDGRVVEFNKEKIKSAILKAFEEVDKNITSYAKDKARDISNYIECLSLKTEMTVESIQDIVEERLMSSNRKDVARAYVRFRYKREIERTTYNELDQEIQGLKDLTSEEVRNNANKAGDKLQTYRPMISDIACINYAKRHVIPEHILKHHVKDIYIHDLNYFDVPMFNCCLVNWEDCFENGMIIGSAPIEKPKSITTAIALISQLAAHVSSNCYGGITFINLTKGLCQYGMKSLEKHIQTGNKWVAKEHVYDYACAMLKNEIKNAMQGLEYEIQTLTNARGEVPFITIELDAIDENATKAEQNIQHLILTSMLKQRLGGLTNGVTPVFPKICFELKNGNNLNPGDPFYDTFKIAVECSSRRLYPDYLMHDKLVEVTGGYKAPMGCRSFIPELSDEDGNRVTGGGFNQGVCSINLVRLAIQSEGNVDKFYSLLDDSLELAKESLLLRHNSLKKVQAKQAPILYQYGAISRLAPEETIEKLLYKNRSTISIGYVGLHNALVALYGESYSDNTEMISKGQEILQYMRNYCDELKKSTNIGFSLYSTPAEVLATKFCKSDIKEFGVIPGVNSNGYYENSFHYPSDTEVNPFDKIDIESEMSKTPSGGAIQYVEFGNMIHNLDALETIIRYAYDKCHYFGVNVSSDRCFACGYVGEMESVDETNNHYRCPQCGNEDNTLMSIIRRLCGYLGSLDERQSIDNKMKEINHRVKHFIGKIKEGIK